MKPTRRGGDTADGSRDDDDDVDVDVDVGADGSEINEWQHPPGAKQKDCLARMFFMHNHTSASVTQAAPMLMSMMAMVPGGVGGQSLPRRYNENDDKGGNKTEK